MTDAERLDGVIEYITAARECLLAGDKEEAGAHLDEAEANLGMVITNLAQEG